MAATWAPEVLDLFLELAAIPSPSGKERPVADRVGTYLTELGLAWDEDASGEAVGSDAGNIYCRLPGRDETGTPVEDSWNAIVRDLPAVLSVEAQTLE